MADDELAAIRAQRLAQMKVGKSRSSLNKRVVALKEKAARRSKDSGLFDDQISDVDSVQEAKNSMLAAILTQSARARRNIILQLRLICSERNCNGETGKGADGRKYAHLDVSIWETTGPG